MLIWLSLTLFITATLVQRWLGEIGAYEFIFNVLAAGVYCIFPYKLARRSNPARWVYAVLFGISVLMFLGSFAVPVPQIDLVVTIIITLLDIYILFCLFHRQSNTWFKPT